MGTGRLIARFPSSTARYHPRPEQRSSMAGQMPGNCRSGDQQDPGFSIARGWPAGCNPEETTKERRRW
jgi:hypothetical protein